MARGGRKKKAKSSSNSTQLAISEKQAPKSLKPKDKKFKKRLETKEGEYASHSQVADEDKSKSSAGVRKDNDPSDNAKGRNNHKRRNERKNKNKEREEKRVDHGPNSERKSAGLIFMCSSKTKADCFRYKVMAMSNGKKDVVLGIKPGRKLFLYDIDLKLLYGIYEASSAGGMKLEAAAFGGGFPAQVRFRVYEDCLPLPESVFKKAIKENYDERTFKFTTELTSKQVNKLKSLFRPIQQSRKDHHPVVQQPSSSSDPLYVTEEEYRAFGLRPALRGLRQDAVSYVPISESYLRSQERDQIFRRPAPIHGDAPSMREEMFRAPGPAFREIPQQQTVVEPALRYREIPQEHTFGEPAVRYGSSSSLRDQAVRSEPAFLSETEYRMYGLRGRTELASEIPVPRTREMDNYREDHYLPSNYHGTSSDTYLRLPRVEAGTYEVYSQTTMTTAHPTDPRPVHAFDNPLPRSTTQEGIYSTYASHELSNYNQRSHHLGGLDDLASAPVSSRYSFAGALYSYR